jgi:hypothetical protein
MAWRLEGTYIETCSCETPCPCSVSFALGADLDYCRIVLGFNLSDGDVDGVDVGGVGAALVVDSPKMMLDGGWKVGLYISDSASDEQAGALAKVFSGQLGGPPAALGPLLGEFLGVERAPMEFSDEGLTHTLKIGDAVDMSVEDVVSFGAENGDPVQLTNSGHVAGSTLTVSKPMRAKVDAFGIVYDGHSGLSKCDFAWSG